MIMDRMNVMMVLLAADFSYIGICQEQIPARMILEEVDV